MPVTMLDAVEFSKIPSLQFVVPVVAADPTGYEAGLIYNSTSKEVKYHNGTAWVALSAGGAAAGGDLSGTYPNPQIAAGVIVDADVNASANIAQSKISGLTSALAGKAATTTTVTAGNGLTGGGDLTTNRTIDVAVGTGLSVAADAVSLDTTYTDGRYINTAGDTMTGTLTLAANPIGALEAATKQYVDTITAGLDFKEAVRACSTTNITLSGTQTVDGVALVANNRVLVAGQTNATENGIYTVYASSWLRTQDADASGEIVDGTVIPVAEGTSNGDSLFICTAVGASPWLPGTVTSTWTKFLTLSDLQAGNGLTKTGTTINFVGDANMSVGADAVSILSAPKWTTARSITLTGDVTGTAASVDGSANVSIATTVVNAGKRYAVDVPTTPSATAPLITHNLNTRDVAVSVYRTTTPWDVVQCGVEITSVNTVTLKFASAVTAGAYRVVVVG